MEFDGLGAQGFLRSAIGCMMIGDSVQTDKGSGVVEGIHEDRSITVRLSDGEHRCLQRDCQLLNAAPVAAPRTELRMRRISNVLNWSGRQQVLHNGQLERLVCGADIELAQNVTSIEIIRGTLWVTGQDQGWGDTGHAGVQLRLKYLHDDGDFDEFTAAKIAYDHNRNRSGKHCLDFKVGLGLKATLPIRVEVFVHTPPWGGWSAFASNVKLDIVVQEETTVMDPLEAWKSIHLSKDDAIKLLWRRCGSPVLQEQDDAQLDGMSWLGHLEVDPSHLSNSGLERQGVVGKSVVKSLTEQGTDRNSVARRLVANLGNHCELSTPKRNNISKMSRVLAEAQKVANSPSEENDRREACDELLAMISFILEGLVTKDEMVEFVASSLAEAATHCWTAWEEAVYIAYHVVCPNESAPINAMTMEIEDWLLGELLALRRDLAYRALAKAKEAAGATDVHFKNFFFSSIHFGLPVLQRVAAHDPSRLNYTMLNLVNMDEVRAGLWRQYTPLAIVAHVRSLFEDSAYWRGRVVDWLRVHCIQGIAPDDWLYTWCHNDDYTLHDEALVFLLASMRILKGDTLCEIRPASVPRRIDVHEHAPELAPDSPRQEPGGHNENAIGRCVVM